MNAQASARRASVIRVAVLVAAAAGLVALGLWIAPHVSRPQVEGWVRGAGRWGPLVLLGVQVLQILIAPIPGVFVPLLAGLLYGPVVGPLVTIAGTFVGSLVAYWIGRRAGRPVVSRWLGPAALEKAHSLLAGKRWVALVGLFLFPFSPADALCFVSGIIDLNVGTFLLAVLLGRVPKDAALALAGAGLLRLGH
jgi:uncharacterized membrane protein YdjX (TVP38/TMEM64 family)